MRVAPAASSQSAAERPEMLRRFVFATGDLVRQETLAFLEGLPNRILTKPLEVNLFYTSTNEVADELIGIIKLFIFSYERLRIAG